MRRYLATLHTKPEHHKKRFALAVSSVATLAIFATWSLINFGNGGVLASKGQEEEQTYREVGPFESFRDSMAASIEGLREGFGELKNGFNSINMETIYTELKEGAVETYDGR